MIANYLVDQNEEYLKARGHSFKDFSPEQILDELRMRDIQIALHGGKTVYKKYTTTDGGSKSFTTIIDGVPQCGASTRWAKLKNPFTWKLYKCRRNKHQA